jgi:hypothetical protein
MRVWAGFSWLRMSALKTVMTLQVSCSTRGSYLAEELLHCPQEYVCCVY